MRIDGKLNIVFPLDTPDGTLYVHSTPIPRDVFERHYLVLGKTFSRIITEGLSIIQGPNMAALLLRDIARETVVPGRAGSALDGPDGVDRTLIPEIRRLTNVAVPSDAGYNVEPLDVAVRAGRIDAEDSAAVENVLCFFTAAVWALRGQPVAAMERMLDGMKLLWGVATTSLNSTEYAASLTTSIPGTVTMTETLPAPSSGTSLAQQRGNSSAAIPM